MAKARVTKDAKEGGNGRATKDRTGGVAAAGRTKTLARVAAPRKIEVAFPKRNQPPTAAAFAARLPLAIGKRFEGVRTFLLKQKGVTEEVFFYGARSGWALRYRREGRPVCSLHLHGPTPLGILNLGAAALATVDWKGLSAIAQRARKAAHGSPNALWLDVPLDGDGANDFKALLRAKLAV
jgi:hypothetical protein